MEGAPFKTNNNETVRRNDHKSMVVCGVPIDPDLVQTWEGQTCCYRMNPTSRRDREAQTIVGPRISGCRRQESEIRRHMMRNKLATATGLNDPIRLYMPWQVRSGVQHKNRSLVLRQLPLSRRSGVTSSVAVTKLS